jgi:hypothetical protein
MRRLRGGPGSGSRLDRIPKYTQCSCLTRAPPRPPVPALSLDTPGITNGDKPLSVPRSNGPARQGSRPRAEREIVRHKRQEIHPIIPSAGNQSLGRCGLRDGAAAVSRVGMPEKSARSGGRSAGPIPPPRSAGKEPLHDRTFVSVGVGRSPSLDTLCRKILPAKVTKGSLVS